MSWTVKRRYIFVLNLTSSTSRMWNLFSVCSNLIFVSSLPGYTKLSTQYGHGSPKGQWDIAVRKNCNILYICNLCWNTDSRQGSPEIFTGSRDEVLENNAQHILEGLENKWGSPPRDRMKSLNWLEWLVTDSWVFLDVLPERMDSATCLQLTRLMGKGAMGRQNGKYLDGVFIWMGWDKNTDSINYSCIMWDSERWQYTLISTEHDDD